MDRLLIAAIAAGLLAALMHRQLLTLAWGIGRALSSLRELARGLDRAGFRLLDRTGWMLGSGDGDPERHPTAGAVIRLMVTAAVLVLAALWGGATEHALGALTGRGIDRAADLARAAELTAAAAVATLGLWLLLAMARPGLRARLFDLDRVARVAGILGGLAAVALLVGSRLLWGGAPAGPVSLGVLTLVALLGLAATAALALAGLLEGVVLATGLLVGATALGLRGVAVVLTTVEGVLQLPRSMLHFLAQAGAKRGPPAGKA